MKVLLRLRRIFDFFWSKKSLFWLTGSKWLFLARIWPKIALGDFDWVLANSRALGKKLRFYLGALRAQLLVLQVKNLRSKLDFEGFAPKPSVLARA